MASSSIRSLTCKFPLRKCQPVLLSSVRLFATASQPAGDRPPGQKKPRPKKNTKIGRPAETEQGENDGLVIRKPRPTKWPPKNPKRASKELSKEPAGEDEDWALAIDEVVGGFPVEEPEPQPQGKELRSQETEAKEEEPKKKSKKKKNKKQKQRSDEDGTKKTEEHAPFDRTEDPINKETSENHHANNLAPISSILDFGLPNRTEKDTLVSSVNDSILGKEPKDQGRHENTPEAADELSLDDLFRLYESSLGSERTAIPEAWGDRLKKAVADRQEKFTKLDQEWERDEEAFVRGVPEEGEGDNEPIRSEEDTTATEWEGVTAEAEEKAGEEAEEPGAKETTADRLTDWLERLEIRRAEQRKKWEGARSKEEARPKEELDAWSSEGRELNTSIIFTQSAQDPSEVDLVWYNQDNYTPTRRYARSSPSEPETVLGRRIGDPNQLLSALSNGRNEYHYSLENLRLMRQGMEVAGLHERLRRTKLPFQFPAIKYEDIENIFRPRLPVGAATAYEPFPLIIPQESAIETPFLWRLIEDNSKYLAIYGDVRTCQGYHPAPSQFFNNFILNFYGYLKPTSIITDANYRQPYSRQQTILSFMGIPTMVLLTVPNQPNAEPIETRNLLAQLIAETFSCHYYNREIMQAQTPIAGLLHHNAQLRVVLYDPIADIPYVSKAIDANLDVPASHDMAKRLKYLSLITNDAFTCAAINGIEAMRHRERQEGETDTTADWREASEGMWGVLEARRMLYIRYPNDDIPLKAHVTMMKGMDQARQGSLAALQSVPPQYRISVGGSMDRWWMTTTRPSWADLRDSLKKQHKKPAGKRSKEPLPEAGGMGGYEYLMR